MKRIAAVIMHSSLGASVGERLVEEGREASCVDLVTTLEGAGLDNILLATNDGPFAEKLASFGVRVHPSSITEPFHFGETLKRIIAGDSLHGLLYFGSGSGGLLRENHIRQLIAFSRRNGRGALFNNFYSCDFAAISGANDLVGGKLPATDNALGFSLSEIGFPCFSLPRELVTQMDIDTPTDLVLLSQTNRCGTALRGFLKRESLTHKAIPPLLEALTDRNATVTLVGRINPGTWAHFEREVACRTSGSVAGRGMHAYPHPQKAFLAATLQRTGVRSFLEDLLGQADGAIIDTRPLLKTDQGLPPPSDRFASDLFRPELIRDPQWAEFTREAMRAKIPILLGGHSLVSGSLFLLAEICWQGKSLSRRLHPKLIDWKKEKA
jgi:hypothetical protein